MCKMFLGLILPIKYIQWTLCKMRFTQQQKIFFYKQNGWWQSVLEIESQIINFIEKNSSMYIHQMWIIFSQEFVVCLNEKEKKNELANVFYFVHVQNTGRLQKISPAY